ncbi:hypothetical protein D8674_005992 [Pyrus ussuriensis x Pyrus communis]|uniref:Uncharacterized protein n=1 Tax=Pyrus ussuriensis x Pyrus communis TaxID=2448454 RepID=A0A5N5FT20_9ROSA|nr:hypothetical protein D8674_005992 [Pyrus ussuriensis x Pyrus communis]
MFAKAFDEKHRLTVSASNKVISFDRKVGLTEKLTVGISMVNEKVKSVDQRLHASDKTMATIFATERKSNDTRLAIKTSRYVTTRAAWLNGAFGKGTKTGCLKLARLQMVQLCVLFSGFIAVIAYLRLKGSIKGTSQ